MKVSPICGELFQLFPNAPFSFFKKTEHQKMHHAAGMFAEHPTRPEVDVVDRRLKLATPPLEMSLSCSAGCEMLTQDGPLKPTGGVDTGGHSVMDY